MESRRLEDMVNYYDILEVEAGASRLKIREAYIRLKNTYSASNQALYSLMGDTDTQKALEILEEAFRVLDDGVSRKDYDSRLRVAFQAQGRDFIDQTVVASPVSSLADETASLVEGVMSPRVLPRGDMLVSPNVESHYHSSADTMESTGTHKQLNEYTPVRKTAVNATRAEIRERVKDMLAQGDPGDGNLYLRIREFLGVTREEVQNYTKISPTYVKGLEENLYATLPALVYVRGFLKGYLKYLGIENPHPLVEAFTEKLTTWMKEQKKDTP